MNIKQLSNALGGGISKIFGRGVISPPLGAPEADVIRPERFQSPQQTRKAKPRKARFSIFRVSAVVIIGLPVVLSSLYFGLIASNQYSSQFSLAVRSSDRSAGGDMMSALLPSIGSSNVSADSYIVVEYLKSRQFLEDASKRLSLTSIYRHDKADILARLKNNALMEEIVEYWRNRVDVRYEPISGIVHASIRTFSPEDSLKLSSAALQLSEKLVNDLSRKARDESILTAEQDVQRGEMRVSAAMAMLKKFRDRTGVVDPQKGAQVGVTALGKLQEELVRLRTQHSILSKNMDPNALPLQNLNQRIAALEDQMRKTRSDISRPTSDSALPEMSSQLLSEFESLELERQFSEKAYTLALASLERARSEASRNQRYLSVFVEPQLAQDSSHPQRLLSVFTVSVIACVCWAVFMLIFLTVREHVA